MESADLQRGDPRSPSIERTVILQRIAKDLVGLTGDSGLSEPILNIHGPSGIGKTELLRQVREHFETQYSTLTWDASDACAGDLEHLTERLNRLIPPDQDSGEPGESIRPLLLLLDSLDGLPFWKQVQAEIIKPLLRRGHTLIICASMAPLFWHFWEIRDCCSLLPLYAFSEEETHQFLMFYDREILTRAVYKMTFGHPQALAQLVRRLNDDLDASPSAGDELALDQLSPDTRVIITYVGLLRHVDVPLMERVIDRFQPHLAAQGARNALYAALTELHTRNMLYPYRKDRQPDRLHRSLRRAVAKRLQAISQEHYLEICDFLAQCYKERLLRQPITRVAALVEWMFFSTERLTNTMRDRQDDWLQDLRRLFATRNLDIPTLIALLHEDSEMLDKLRTVGMLADVKALLYEYLDDEAEIPLQLEFQFSRKEMIKPLFNDITASIPIRGVQKYIDDIIHMITQIEGPFDAAELHRLLNNRNDGSLPITQRHVEDTLTLLNLHGFLVYDPEQRTYQPDPNQILRSLAAPQNTPNLLENHVGGKPKRQEKQA